METPQKQCKKTVTIINEIPADVIPSNTATHQISATFNTRAHCKWMQYTPTSRFRQKSWQKFQIATPPNF